MNDDKYTLDEFLLDFGNIQTTFHSHYLGIELNTRVLITECVKNLYVI